MYAVQYVWNHHCLLVSCTFAIATISPSGILIVHSFLSKLTNSPLFTIALTKSRLPWKSGTKSTFSTRIDVFRSSTVKNKRHVPFPLEVISWPLARTTFSLPECLSNEMKLLYSWYDTLPRSQQSNHSYFRNRTSNKIRSTSLLYWRTPLVGFSSIGHIGDILIWHNHFSGKRNIFC